MGIVRRKKRARIDSDRFAGFNWSRCGGWIEGEWARREFRANYKHVSFTTNSGLAIRSAWLAFRYVYATEFLYFSGKSEWRVSAGQKATLPNPTTRAPTGPHTWLPSLHPLPLYVFLIPSNFCASSIAPPFSRNRKWIDVVVFVIDSASRWIFGAGRWISRGLIVCIYTFVRVKEFPWYSCVFASYEARLLSKDRSRIRKKP